MINPNTIHCLALNFKGITEEGHKPLYFVKSNSTLCFEGSKVPYPKFTNKVWTEVELGIVISQDCENVSVEDVDSVVEGYTICADMTCENLYGRDHHLAFSKSRKNFCPTKSEIIKMDIPLNTRFTTEINGKVTQVGTLKKLVYGPAETVNYVSQLIPLQAGDLILTGTIAGVENNIVQVGDHIKHTVEKLGDLEYDII